MNFSIHNSIDLKNLHFSLLVGVLSSNSRTLIYRNWHGSIINCPFILTPMHKFDCYLLKSSIINKGSDIYILVLPTFDKI